MADTFGANIGKGLAVTAIVLAGACAYWGKEITDAYVQGQKFKAEKAKYEYLSQLTKNSANKDLASKLENGTQ